MATRWPSMFVRPRNMVTTHLLQTLSIARSAAKSARGALVYVRFAREVDQKRILNFATFVYTSDDAAAAQARLYNNDAEVVKLNSRAARDYASLKQVRTINEGVGLREVAPLVGIELNRSALMTGEEIEDEILANNNGDRESFQSLTLAEPDEFVESDVFEVTLQMENQLRTDRATQPRSSNRFVRSRPKRGGGPSDSGQSSIDDLMKQFNGFSDRISRQAAGTDAPGK